MEFGHFYNFCFGSSEQLSSPEGCLRGSKSGCGVSIIKKQKILIFMGVSKSFGTNITENHLGNLSSLFFGQALDQMGQKCQYLAQNASFGPNLAVFGPKIQFFGGRE